MQVGDDGAPMDVDLSRSMPSVRHRLFAAGGTVEAEARDGQGNQVRVFVPRSAAVSA
jgi:signal transduction histidine kinase